MGTNRLKRSVILVFATLLFLAVYLLVSISRGQFGFPLDDAWIHQTFARNLAQYGQWAFIPGQISGGSTSPLWTMLLAVGQWLQISPVVWSGFLGGLFLVLSGLLLDETLKRKININVLRSFPLAGLIIVGEWHLVWAALSGMETVLYIFLICLTFFALGEENQKWLYIGLIAGVAIWVRPDGITLFGPILLVSVVKSKSIREILNVWSRIFLGFALMLTPYLLFNFFVDGAILPNTFFAKQAEYAGQLQVPVLERWFSLFFQLQVGVGIVLLPGLIYQSYLGIKQRNCWVISAVLWVMGYITLFALRLPVTYQHARYLMPAMPVYFFLGLWGFFQFLDRTRKATFIADIMRKSWSALIGVVWLVFFILGAFSFANDVTIIETEMVEAATWIASHTDSEAIIAAHDIGALGYYGNRDVIDMAGLIHPEVIPFIRDQDALLSYIIHRNADYLLTFPGWYPEIVNELEPIYSTQKRFSPEAGGENMTLYRLGN